MGEILCDCFKLGLNHTDLRSKECGGRGERDLPFYQGIMVVGEKERYWILELPGDDGSRRERGIQVAYSLDLEVSSSHTILPTTILLFPTVLFAIGCGSQVTLSHNICIGLCCWFFCENPFSIEPVHGCAMFGLSCANEPSVWPFVWLFLRLAMWHVLSRV